MLVLNGISSGDEIMGQLANNIFAKVLSAFGAHS
jgi:hypothetical protein